MKFEDLNTYDGKTTYTMSNESLEGWGEVLKDISVERAAAICSGGEVAFFSILPHVQEELQLIDHCYSSLYFAIGKYKIIEDLGPKKSLKLLSTYSGSTNEVPTLISKANEGLPTLYGRFKESKFCYTHTMWEWISQKEVDEFSENKEKISFLHGDLSDLIDRGPFDLVYISNALDYKTRKNVYVDPATIERIVKPGGFIAHSYLSTNKANKAGWKTVAEYRIPYGSRKYGLDWNDKL